MKTHRKSTAVIVGFETQRTYQICEFGDEISTASRRKKSLLRNLQEVHERCVCVGGGMMWELTHVVVETNSHKCLSRNHLSIFSHFHYHYFLLLRCVVYRTDSRWWRCLSSSSCGSRRSCGWCRRCWEGGRFASGSCACGVVLPPVGELGALGVYFCLFSAAFSFVLSCAAVLAALSRLPFR